MSRLTAPPAAKIAAVIVCYGDSGNLSRCIDSLLAQGSPHLTSLVLVDNNPPAGRVRLESLPRGFAAAGGRILTPGSNLGFGRAVNLAATEIPEAFLLVVNPDLVLEPGALEMLRLAIESDAGIAAVGPTVVQEGTGEAVNPPASYPRLGRDLLALSGLSRLGARGRGRSPAAADSGPTGRGTQPRTFLSGACLLVRRDALSRVGGFDPRFFLYYEDADLCRRLTQAGCRLHLAPDARARHVHGGSFEDPVFRGTVSLRGALLYHRKHGGRFAEEVYRLGMLFLYLPRLALGFLSLLPGLPRTSFTAGQRWRMMRAVLRVAFGDPSDARLDGGGR